MNNKTRFLTYGSVIAALYVALTLLANALGLASGVIQVRLSEALTILPMFTPAAVPGLFVGCVLANLLTGCAPWDVVFGSLATLIGALGTWKLAKNKWIAPLFPILSNAIICPLCCSMFMRSKAATGTSLSPSGWAKSYPVGFSDYCCIMR